MKHIKSKELLLSPNVGRFRVESLSLLTSLQENTFVPCSFRPLDYSVLFKLGKLLAYLSNS